MLFLYRIAILAASLAVPRSRAAWRSAWISEIRHYRKMLRQRGLRRRYVRVRTWHHFVGAMLNAWCLFTGRPSVVWFHSAMRSPAFCLGAIALALALIAATSHGFAITRAMLFPPYPDAGRLIVISQGGILQNDRHEVPAALLNYWRSHDTTLAGIAGYHWNRHGTASVTQDFFTVLGTRPYCFLLRRVRQWQPLAGARELGVLGRLKPGVTPDDAQVELRSLAARYGGYADSEEIQVTPLVTRTRQPLLAYAGLCGTAVLALLLAAGSGMRTDRRRTGHIRRKYWAYFCAKAVFVPLVLALMIWEYTHATSFSPAGRALFVAKPLFIWLVILACAAIVWWSIWDQLARCRACLRTLQYPVRIGSMGAILFDHSGTELVCCQGHGSYYLPAVSSDYIQRGGWTTLDIEDAPSHPVPH